MRLTTAKAPCRKGFEEMTDTEKKPRTREDQVSELTRELKASLTALDSKLRVELMEAEERGAAEQQRKETEIDKDRLADLIEGMEVSIDVSTCDENAGHRLFGTVTVVQEYGSAKNGLILLVQEAEPNFYPHRKDAKGQEPVGYVSETAMILITGGGYEGVNLRKHRGSKSFSNAWGQDIPLYTHPANVAALEAENASLREQLAKARKDTERLDWLSKKSLIAVWDRNEKALSPNKVCDYVFVNYGSPDAWHDLLRFQVDSAMKQSEGESP